MGKWEGGEVRGSEGNFFEFFSDFLRSRSNSKRIKHTRCSTKYAAIFASERGLFDLVGVEEGVI
jgi:hypothetical protein